MRPNTLEDVWRLIDQRGPSECWPYLGSTFSGRYGRFFFRQKALLAHRVVCAMVHGESDQIVLHKCNNKMCCNPAHLAYGTPDENARHAVASSAFPAGKTGIPGISFIKSRGYWSAQGWRKGRRVNLYTGPHLHKAIQARRKWVESYGLDLTREVTA